MVDDATPSDDVLFTDLAERLRGPEGPQAAADALSRIEALEAGVARAMREGLPPGEFEPAQDLAGALAAARRVMIMASASLAKMPGAEHPAF